MLFYFYGKATGVRTSLDHVCSAGLRVLSRFIDQFFVWEKFKCKSAVEETVEETVEEITSHTWAVMINNRGINHLQ